jgi:hypothetical protein
LLQVTLSLLVAVIEVAKHHSIGGIAIQLIRGWHRNHFRREEVDALTECDLLIRIRVDYLQELLNALRGEVVRQTCCLVVTEAKMFHQLSELRLVEHTISISVDLLEVLNEEAKELLVLAQLEVENTLKEHVELELGRISLSLICIAAGNFAGSRASLACHVGWRGRSLP